MRTKILKDGKGSYSPIVDKDSVIDENGVSVIPEIIKNAGGLLDITWAELKGLRNGGNLVVGKQYRITDYHCTTTQEYTQSADHQFDIIVTADDESTLNENARACLHDGDTYFSGNNANLGAWELKYSLDNDTDKFQWASTSGKGVIYWMKDEWNNECPYDFKNIMFKRTISYNEGSQTWVVDSKGKDTYLYTFSVYDTDNGNWIDAVAAISKAAHDGVGCGISENVINSFRFKYCTSDYNFCYRLNNIVFINTVLNIIVCANNVFAYNCYDNTFGSICYYNTFGNNCHSNTFGDGFFYNTFGNDCHSNTFGNGCYYNTFGNFFHSNKFGHDCYYNTFGNYCGGNILGNYMRWCSFEDCVKYVVPICSTGSSAYLQNMHVLNGTQGASDINYLPIIITASRSYCTYVGKNSSGELKIWNPADMVFTDGNNTTY